MSIQTSLRNFHKKQNNNGLKDLLYHILTLNDHKFSRHFFWKCELKMTATNALFEIFFLKLPSGISTKTNDNGPKIFCFILMINDLKSADTFARSVSLQ